MKPSISKTLLCLLSLGVLTACAPPQMKSDLTIPSDVKSEQQTTTQVSNISSWEISGAMAAKNQSKSWSASLNWVQVGPNQYHIRLSGPLGGGTVLIEKSHGVITYQDGPKKITSKDADALLAQQTGIRLPVNKLYYWVRGLPASSSTQSVSDAKGHITTLNEDGYVIHYLNYTNVNNVELPQKIALQGHGVTMKLVVNQWTI